ncbi:MAG: hypothetical protein M1821_000805 [Bathelium mastoideum]|nr:MAG: hypothetical protein M1821_000805 [Bathelium mastoideum]
MASNEDGYMLRRDSEERHMFFRCLSGGSLLHPSIPIKNIETVADVTAGTGIWLRQLAESSDFAGRPNTLFVEFDIAQQQHFNKEEMRESIRLELAQLENVVRNIVQILRPGGYLQWQECDPGDGWTAPENPTSTSMINYVIAEKVARGLIPGITTKIHPGQQNVDNRSTASMRIKQLVTVSTAGHADPQIAVGKKFAVISTASVLLDSSINRNKAAAENMAGAEKEKLEKDVLAMTGFMKAIKKGESDAINNWDFEMTWIVARKALVLKEGEMWMTKKYPAS